jgi:hypothetical protein
MNNNIWGPAIWKLLHIVAERVETIQKSIHMQLLVLALPAVLACRMCQTHAALYIKGNPYNPKAAGPTAGTIRDYTRRWVWEFHETVNMKNGYSSGIQLTDLPRLYGVNTNITNLLNILDSQEKLAADAGIVKEGDYAVFRRHILKLF